MASPVFALCLTCLFLGKMAQTTDVESSPSVQHETGFVSVKTGDDLSLKCFYEGVVGARLYWYKQMLGQKPRLISTFYMYDKKKYFYGEFKNNPRFTLETDTESTLVNVRDSGLNIPALVHQSASESIQPGGSVTLNCTVHTGSCDGEHSVYWFKNSEESHPGLIYSHGGRNDQCERKANTQTHTCVYNLPIKSLNPSHAGTYYCAVASCGHILFGDGTKLDFNVSAEEEKSLDLVYFWSGTSIFTSILAVLLAFLVCQMSKRNSHQSTEFAAASIADVNGYQHAEKLYYAALSVNLSNRSRRHRNQTWSECVYFNVKQ